MKKWLLIGTIIYLWLGLAGISGAHAAGQEIKAPSFSGVYQVTVTTDQGLNRTAQLTIEDFKNGEVQVNYDYEGYPFGLVGEVNGQADQEGAVCRFAVDYPGVVTAQAEFTIIKVADNYQLQGQGSGNYNYQGQSGQVAAQITGFRLRPLAPPSRTPLGIIAVIAGLVLMVLVVACFRLLKSQPGPPFHES